MSMMIDPYRFMSAYSIANAALFDGSTGYLTRTSGVPTDASKWTVSVWLHRNKLTSGANAQTIFTSGLDGGVYHGCLFAITDEIRISDGVVNALYNGLQRDLAAWNHLVVSFDNSQVGSEKYVVELNGVTQTFKSGSYTSTAAWNKNAIDQLIGRGYSGGEFQDGYIANMHSIDGQVLSASDFGEFDLVTGNWKAKSYSGTYGNNGFYLDFSNGADLGEDHSGDYSRNLRTSGTNIGDMTSYGGLAAAFNGSPDGNTTSAALAGNIGYTGKDWGSGVSKAPKRVTIDAPTNENFHSVGAGATLSILVSDTNDPTVATQVWSADVGATVGDHVDTGNIVGTVSGRYWWVKVLGATSGGTVYFGEIGFYEDGDFGFNHWTVNGGVTQVTSTPTNITAMLNPLAVSYNSMPTLSNGNRTITGGDGLYQNAALTIKPDGLKGYFEFDFTGTIDAFLAFDDAANAINTDAYAEASCHRTRVDGSLAYGAATLVSSYLPTMTTGVRYGCAFDFTGSNRNVWFRNATVWGTRVGVGDPAAGTNAGFTATELVKDSYNILPMVWSGCGMNIYTEDAKFTYTPPTGFKSLCTNNLPKIADSIDNHFKTILYTGTGSIKTVTTDLDTKFAWLKARNSAAGHMLYDAMRGAGYRLNTNTTSAEALHADTLTSFTSTGFTLGADTTTYSVNKSGDSYVAWCASLPNTKTSGWSGSPTITPTKEIYNAKLGMSIITYTGNGTAGATIPHSLGRTPKFVMIKRRDATSSWIVYHALAGAGYLTLETVNAYTNAATYWTTEATDTRINTLTSSAEVNASGATYVAYIFAETEFCKIGSYAGNGSTDGPMVNKNFSPIWSLIKSTAAGLSWAIYDNARDPYNPQTGMIFANSAGTEIRNSAYATDAISNGFKVRCDGGNNHVNVSGNTYLYLMFGQPNGPVENTAR